MYKVYNHLVSVHSLEETLNKYATGPDKIYQHWIEPTDERLESFKVVVITVPKVYQLVKSNC